MPQSFPTLTIGKMLLCFANDVQEQRLYKRQLKAILKISFAHRLNID